MQGVGFRPFVVRLAEQHRQNGWIANSTEGVVIAIEGRPEQQEEFLFDLNNRLPPFAEIKSLSIRSKPSANYQKFQIRSSLVDDSPSGFVLPDIATCQDCRNDIVDSNSRFFHYPFTSCCNCGPRYSIMLSQPFDRDRTVMARFKLCDECEADYRSITNRRFHAQTIACPKCGPQTSLLDATGLKLAEKNDALLMASQFLKAGKIVALKGIGGFQLLADASSQAAVERLRLRKQRPEKPLAVLVENLGIAEKLCFINEKEKAALASSAAPIVLLKRRNRIDDEVCESVAPDTDWLGIMLPYSSLHHLVFRDFDAPLVATSGNRRDEPICVNDEQAFSRLSGIADYFLTHNRPILRPLDDSIVRLINGTVTVLRRARGFVPLPITLNTALDGRLSVGGQLKSTIAVCRDRQAVLSQHLGDLASEAAQQQFEATVSDMTQFYRISPTKIIRDSHPGYASSQFADRLPGDKKLVQHHYAHVLSCMAEHGLEPPVLGVAWDGSGLGEDNTLWGGEFLAINRQGFQRYAHFRAFPLPGGAKAIQEPRRSALGLLYEIFADDPTGCQNLPFTEQELGLLYPALKNKINCPKTTSVGRLFDAVASLLGLCHINSYEGQAAVKLENTAAMGATELSYAFGLGRDVPILIDWQITLEQLLEDIPHETSPLIAAKFHNTLANMIAEIAKRAQIQQIVLSGGCFQNALLVERAADRLKRFGFNVYCHEKIPPNDGGLALGQLYADK